MILLPATIITGPLTLAAMGGASIPGLPVKSLLVSANFNYGSGGLTLDAYVQSSIDGGLTWNDIAPLVCVGRRPSDQVRDCLLGHPAAKVPIATRFSNTRSSTRTARPRSLTSFGSFPNSTAASPSISKANI